MGRNAELRGAQRTCVDIKTWSMTGQIVCVRDGGDWYAGGYGRLTYVTATADYYIPIAGALLRQFSHKDTRAHQWVTDIHVGE